MELQNNIRPTKILTKYNVAFQSYNITRSWNEVVCLCQHRGLMEWIEIPKKRIMKNKCVALGVVQRLECFVIVILFV